MKKILFIFLFLPFITNAQIIVTDTFTNSLFGNSPDAQFNSQYGIALDNSGNLYVCEAGDECVRKISPAYRGVLTNFAGINHVHGYAGDGNPAYEATLDGPNDVVTDHYGNVYIADQSNNAIRKVSTSDIITTIAGNGTAGYNGDNIPATTAELSEPANIAVDNAGNVYISDWHNYRIRKVDTSGIITTIAGTGVAGFSPDGSKADTSAIEMYGLRVDKAGNIIFVDNYRIRKIDTAGIITTIAGNGTFGYSGDGGLATEAEIGGDIIALDSLGNIFIADGVGQRIREISNNSGIIYTVAGGGTNENGDGGNPLDATLISPAGLAVTNSGDIYISDVAAHVIRVVLQHPLGIPDVECADTTLRLYPNPSSGALHFTISSNTNEQANITITNAIGEVVKYFFVVTNKENIVSIETPGLYFFSATIAGKQIIQKIVIQ